jgi:hypothetical protein
MPDSSYIGDIGHDPPTPLSGRICFASEGDEDAGLLETSAFGRLKLPIKKQNVVTCMKRSCE